jgi:hypothetical protein
MFLRACARNPVFARTIFFEATRSNENRRHKGAGP